MADYFSSTRDREGPVGGGEFTGPPRSHALLHPLTGRQHSPERPLSSTASDRTPSGAAPVPPASSTSVRPANRQRSSTVRIRRLGSSQKIPGKQVAGKSNGSDAAEDRDEQTGRRRSFSEPLSRPTIEDLHMPTLREEPNAPVTPGQQPAVPEQSPRRPQPQGRLRSAYRSAQTGLQRTYSRATQPPNEPSDAQARQNEYDSQVVDLLDVVDPEVSTLATLTNVQNSLFIPNLGRFINRRPTYDLTRRPRATDSSSSDSESDDEYELPPIEPHVTFDSQLTTADDEGNLEPVTGKRIQGQKAPSFLSRKQSITSVMSDSRYAVLPHGVSLDGWSEEDKRNLNDHVRHFLHSRRSKFKRGMKGFGKYIQRPLGFLVSLYASLITVFGLIWVLFLIGWISGGSDARHEYLINVIDNVLVALFAVVGDGLAPFRAYDTYHMIFIARYAHLTWKLRDKKDLPDLENPNDLPTDVIEADLESGVHEKRELSVLSPLQQKRLAHHQKKFARSHTFYRPHETDTHRAFSIRILIAIVVLLDCHSMFQIALGSVTWGISYHHRSQILTTVILCCSISCNALGGILISIGDKRSRKKEVVERMFRQELTEEAIKKVRKHKRKAAKAKAREEAEAAEAAETKAEADAHHQAKAEAEAEAEALEKRSSALDSDPAAVAAVIAAA